MFCTCGVFYYVIRGEGVLYVLYIVLYFVFCFSMIFFVIKSSYLDTIDRTVLFNLDKIPLGYQALNNLDQSHTCMVEHNVFKLKEISLNMLN